MSRLDELIQELCPEGVPYKKIREVYTRLKGTPITAGKMKEIEDPNGKIRIFAGGKTVINANENDIPKANITTVPAVLVQSRGVIDFVYYESPFTFKNEMWAYTAPEKISVKYLYYVLKNSTMYFRDAASGMGALPQISLRVTEDFVIPLPPLSVQKEIVRILDLFTAFTGKLQKELKGELEARKNQYEYYKGTLLSFVNRRDVPRMKLNDVCTLQSGGTPSKSNADYWEKGTIKWLSSTVCKNRKVIDDVTDYITELGLKKSSAKMMKSGTTLIALVGATIGKLGFLTFDAAINQNVVGVYPKDTKVILPEYVYYICGTLYGRFLSISNGKLAMANMSFVRGLEIPVPSIEEQTKIISILNQFEELNENMLTRILAELEARQKQYEYYRDKLLTFKEKSC